MVFYSWVASFRREVLPAVFSCNDVENHNEYICLIWSLHLYGWFQWHVEKNVDSGD